MIYLNREEVSYLLRVLSLPPDLREKLGNFGNKGGYVDVDRADILRDLCGERLQSLGFEKGYEPTEEGRFLETMIDRLFTG